MTSIDFLEKVYGILNDQNYRITFSPAQRKNWMMNCNGHFIGGLFNEELCLTKCLPFRLKSQKRRYAPHTRL